MSPQTLDPLQTAVDEVVTSWPGVHGKQVFGHRGWVRGGSMFGFAADSGVSVKAADPGFAQELYERDGVTPFIYGDGMTMQNWPVLPLAAEEQLECVLSTLMKAYEAAV